MRRFRNYSSMVIEFWRFWYFCVERYCFLSENAQLRVVRGLGELYRPGPTAMFYS